MSCSVTCYDVSVPFSSVFTLLLWACCCGCLIGDVIHQSILSYCCWKEFHAYLWWVKTSHPQLISWMCKDTLHNVWDGIYIQSRRQRQTEGVLCLFTAHCMFTPLISSHVIFLLSSHQHVLFAFSSFTVFALCCVSTVNRLQGCAAHAIEMEVSTWK